MRELFPLSLFPSISSRVSVLSCDEESGVPPALSEASPDGTVGGGPVLEPEAVSVADHEPNVEQRGQGNQGGGGRGGIGWNRVQYIQA